MVDLTGTRQKTTERIGIVDGMRTADVECGSAKLRPSMITPTGQNRLLLIIDLPLVSRAIQHHQPSNYLARGLAIDGYQK